VEGKYDNGHLLLTVATLGSVELNAHCKNLVQGCQLFSLMAEVRRFYFAICIFHNFFLLKQTDTPHASHFRNI